MVQLQEQARAWRPQENGLRELLSLIEMSRSVNTDDQKKVYEKLGQLERLPELNGYLSFIFTSTSHSSEIRQRAGLLLRNNIKKSWNLTPPYIREVIKLVVINTLGDKDKIIRRTLSSIVATLMTEILDSGLVTWPTLFEQMTEILRAKTQSPEYIDSVLNIFVKVITDLEGQQGWGNKIDPVVPVMNELLNHSEPLFRQQALEILYQFFIAPPPAFFEHIDTTIQKLSNLTRDTTPNVRKFVCRCLVPLVERFYNKVEGNMDEIIKFQLQCTSDSNTEVSLEAAEFWSCFVLHQGTNKALLTPYLPQLVPILLQNMIYTEEQLAEKDLANDDAAIEDKDDDVAPAIHKSKTDEKEEKDPNDDTSWNIRKCSARSLDHIANVYRDKLLEVLLPLIEKILQAPKWPVRESAILAIGAIGNGCGQALENYLPRLIPFLINLQQDNQPLIRSMACWSTARYCQWMVMEKMQDPNNKYLEQFLERVLKCVLDNSKQVQEAACSALSELMEAAQEGLNQYIEVIVSTVQSAFQKYKRKNSSVLHDVCMTLVENVPGISTPLQNSDLESRRVALVDKLVKPVLQQYMRTDLFDPQIFTIMATIMSFSVRLQKTFTPYLQHIVPRIFESCKSVIRETKSAVIRTVEERKEVQQRKQFLHSSLDGFSAIVEGQGADTVKVLNQNELLEIVFHTVQDDDIFVRRSSFSVLGDLYSRCPVIVVPHTTKFLPIAIKNLDPFCPAVCINALWTIGETVSTLKDKVQPYAEEIIKRSVIILEQNTGPIESRRVKDNAAIIIARCALYLPDEVAKYGDQLRTSWVQTLTYFPEDPEKVQAFNGLLRVLDKNLAGFCKTQDDMTRLIAACCMWQQPPKELVAMFIGLMATFKQKCPPETWRAICAQMQQTIPVELHYNFREYGIA